MSNKKLSDKKLNRSRWAVDDKGTPHPSLSGSLTPAEMQAAMAKADCGIARQHELSTAVRRDQRPIAINQNHLLAVRDCNVPGTEAAENARANQAKLKGWGAVGTLSDSDDDGKKDIAGGQTHRTTLRNVLREDHRQEPLRLTIAGDTRQLHAPARHLAPAQALAYPVPRSTSSTTTPDVIKRDSPDLLPLTDDEWHEIKRLYDELGIAHIKPLTQKQIAASREELYKSRSRRGPRPGTYPSASSSAPLRSRPARSAPVSNAWAPGNLAINPTPLLNLLNPSVTTTEAEMRRRLGTNFIEIVEPEPTVSAPDTTSQPAQEPVSRLANPFEAAIAENEAAPTPKNTLRPNQHSDSRPASFFDDSEPFTITLKKDIPRAYGSAGIETAVVEASFALAQSGSQSPNPFDAPSPPTRAQETTPTSTPNYAVIAVVEQKGGLEDDKLMDLVDGKLKDFHITKKYEDIEPPIPEKAENPEEFDLAEFEQGTPDLLDNTPEKIPHSPLQPTISMPPTSIFAKPPTASTTVSEGIQSCEVGISATPATVTAAHTAPLLYMGPAFSSFHHEALSSSEAFWAQQQLRIQGNPFTLSGAPRTGRDPATAPTPTTVPTLRQSSLNVSSWARATHTPPRNDSA